MNRRFTQLSLSFILSFVSMSLWAQSSPQGKINGSLSIAAESGARIVLQYEVISSGHTYTITIRNPNAKTVDHAKGKLPNTNANTEEAPENTKPAEANSSNTENNKKKDTEKTSENTKPAEANSSNAENNKKKDTEDQPSQEEVLVGNDGLQEEEVTSTFYEMSLNIFKDVFKNLVIQVLGEKTKHGVLETTAIQTFYQIQARLDFLDDEPMTARFILKKDDIQSFLSSNTSTHYSGVMSELVDDHIIKDLEIEIEYGALKNITLRTTFGDRDAIRNFLVFKNQFPFSSSSKFDPENISKLRLYCQNCGGVENVVRFVKLGDLLIIDNILENQKEDYSPYNQTLSLTPASSIKEVRKERRSKIIDISAFTDFNGFEGDKPNGLIQVEASRRINLNTRHILLGRKKDIASYFDYGQIEGRPEFIEMPNKRKLVFRLDFIPSYHDSVLINAIRTFNDVIPITADIAARAPMERLVKDFSNQLRTRRRKFVYHQKSLSRFIRDVSERYQGDEATYEPNEKNMISGRPIIPGSDTTYKLSGYYQMKLKRLKINYVNFFGYFEPTFRFSKIEENNRTLTLPDSNFIEGRVHINPISLYQHQKISLGGDINIVKLSFTQSKINFYLNGGIMWYQTDIRLEQDEENRIATAYNYRTDLFVKFNPDGRWGCAFGVEYSRANFISAPYRFSANSEMMQYKFDAFLNTNGENKLFFRFRLINQYDNLKNSFSQIQFGYSMNIFQGNNVQRARY